MNLTVSMRIRQLLTRHPDSGILSQLADTDLEELALAAAAAPIRVAQARWMPVDSLVWNQNNLRPAVREALEKTLVRRACALCSQRDLKPEAAPETDSAEEKAAAAPPLMPPLTPKEDPPASKPMASSESTPRPPQKEDWFDGFLTFISNLFS